MARIEGKAVFVPGALPGEEVLLRVVDDRRSWARAELVEVRDARPDRVEPPCEVAGVCGGCDLQHASPDAQRRLKTQVVREQLQRLGGIVDPPVEDCRTVGGDLGYRSHVRMHAAEDGRLGFHRVRSHDVVPVERCPVMTAPLQALRELVGDATGAAEVVLRSHARGAAIVLTPGSAPLELPPDDGQTSVLLAQPNGSLLAVRGDGVLRETVAGLELAFDAGSFFQVSVGGAEALVAEVLAGAGDVAGALVWDLYAGVGLLSLPLAAAGAEVVAVEGDAASARMAARNAQHNQLDLEVIAAPVEEVTRRAVAGTGDPPPDPPDVVVLDPPRTGAGERVVADLVSLGPATIVYVACDPASLARDARQLAAAGFRLRRVVPLDLFPMTHHVETVATFVR